MTTLICPIRSAIPGQENTPGAKTTTEHIRTAFGHFRINLNTHYCLKCKSILQSSLKCVISACPAFDALPHRIQVKENMITIIFDQSPFFPQNTKDRVITEKEKTDEYKKKMLQVFELGYKINGQKADLKFFIDLFFRKAFFGDFIIKISETEIIAFKLESGFVNDGSWRLGKILRPIIIDFDYLMKEFRDNYFCFASKRFIDMSDLITDENDVFPRTFVLQVLNNNSINESSTKDRYLTHSYVDHSHLDPIIGNCIWSSYNNTNPQQLKKTSNFEDSSDWDFLNHAISSTINKDALQFQDISLITKINIHLTFIKINGINQVSSIGFEGESIINTENGIKSLKWYIDENAETKSYYIKIISIRDSN